MTYNDRMTDTRRFGRLMRQARRDAGLSSVALAKRTKMQPSAISHFEGGRREPSLSNFARIADALGVTMDSLVGRTVHPKESR